MKKWIFLFYSVFIIGFASKSLVLNTWSLLNFKLPKYYINDLFLSGTLLLYDRPMFFESRQIEVKLVGQTNKLELDYNLSTPGYNSYLQRRFFRFATDDLKCGIDRKLAMEDIFCKSKLEILKDRTVENVIVRFLPFWKSGKERLYTHECRHNE